MVANVLGVGRQLVGTGRGGRDGRGGGLRKKARRGPESAAVAGFVVADSWGSWVRRGSWVQCVLVLGGD